MDVQRQAAAVLCDDKCAKLLAAKRAKEAEEAAKKEEEERVKNAKLAADFERSMKGGKRARKHRTKSESEVQVSWREKLPSFKQVVIVSAIIAGMGAVVAATIIGLQIEG